MSFAYLPFYTGDYFRDTRGLSMAGHGCYFLMLTYCWDSKGPLPLDLERIAGICEARNQEERITMARVLETYFVEMVDGWYNGRMQKEIERSEAISGKRRDAALIRHGQAAPVQVNFGQRVRSARLSAARSIATHTRREWELLVEFHEGKCVKCGSDSMVMVKDHIVPLHQGGHDGIENIQPMCGHCNHDKGMDTTDYRKKGWKEVAVQEHAFADQVQLSPSPSPSPSPKKVKSPVASRLPPGWQAPDEWINWATGVHGLDEDRAIRISLVFRDYWISKPGKDGCKLDWFATWRNWIRKECGQ